MDDLTRRMAFIIECDKMKNILRQTLLADGSRRENDAEHSWHLALCAMTLWEYAPDGADLMHVLKMALVHDLVEIDAGDTFAYDPAANLDKSEREQAAAQRVFGLLPDEQAREFHALWEEFETMETPEALFAAAMDRLQPMLNNYQTQGHTWKLGSVHSAQVYQRLDPVRRVSPALWEYVQRIIADSIQKGWILP